MEKKVLRRVVFGLGGLVALAVAGIASMNWMMKQPPICLEHVGPYKQIGRTYAKLFACAREHKKSIVVPLREVFMKGPGIIFKGNPKNYITEVQLVVSDSKAELS